MKNSQIWHTFEKKVSILKSNQIHLDHQGIFRLDNGFNEEMINQIRINPLIFPIFSFGKNISSFAQCEVVIYFRDSQNSNVLVRQPKKKKCKKEVTLTCDSSCIDILFNVCMQRQFCHENAKYGNIPKSLFSFQHSGQNIYRNKKMKGTSNCSTLSKLQLDSSAG